MVYCLSLIYYLGMHNKNAGKFMYFLYFVTTVIMPLHLICLDIFLIYLVQRTADAVVTLHKISGK